MRNFHHASKETSAHGPTLVRRDGRCCARSSSIAKRTTFRRGNDSTGITGASLTSGKVPGLARSRNCWIVGGHRPPLQCRGRLSPELFQVSTPENSLDEAIKSVPSLPRKRTADENIRRAKRHSPGRLCIHC